jgi:ketosteroid isomerase-like protein
MRSMVLLLAALVPAIPLSLAGQQYGPIPDAPTRTEILRIREGAWRAWFANDHAAFQRIVPDELVALSWGGGAWEDRAQTLHSMRAYAESGEKLTALEFPRNVFQQYGDVVILYSSFRIVLTARDGKEQVTTGRGTEIFVRRNGKWIHTGWHLDTLPS